MPSPAFAACEQLVREHDPDRYYAALFAPADKRAHLYALYAFYYELARVPDAAREPMIADIRLAWWRETLEGARAGKARPHDVVRALSETLAAHDLPSEMFERIFEARSVDIGREPFSDTAAAIRHADDTSGGLMRLAMRILGAEADEAARQAGIAYALAGRHGGMFAAVETALPEIVEAHYAAVRTLPVPRLALPAILPAALVPLYRKAPDPPLWRKQIALFLAAMRGLV